MRIKKSLALNPAQKTMTYMDKWSSKFTWGGDLANKPVEGDLAVLTEGKLFFLSVISRLSSVFKSLLTQHSVSMTSHDWWQIRQL